MSTKQEGRSKANTSSVLFMTADGEPMTFFLRPGPVKRKLQPLITSGGGMLCNVQQPGAILLIDPEERGSIFESTAHWYVSTNYISDCTERKERLNIEDYRLNPEVVPRHSTRLKNKGSRIPYTPEDDAAILNYVCNHKNDTGGNQLWQAMEKEHVTNHSWQSMKYRYRVKLAKKLSTAKEVKIDKETKVIYTPGGGVARFLQSKQFQYISPSKQTEAAEPIKTTSPQEETVSDYSLQSCHCSSTPENHKQPKQSPSAELEQPQRRLTRRQLEHEMSSLSEPYSKKLRSSTSVDKQVLSPQSTKKTRPPVVKQTIDSPPPKRPRVNGVAAVAAVAERQQDESEEAAIFETPEAGSSFLNLLPQTVEKKKGKKKLGILELATKEFEDESEVQLHTDLASVTKALLRTSGDFSAALDVLLDPSSISGPFWNQHDDSLLRSADPVLLLQLKEKYSEEEVAKRTVFLEVGK
uniref:Telomeric repeat-binding factor 2-interacting protein 1 n=1 Tax=Echeneis naucrates TaxID=173247 RepID=A0A665UJR6_ECHNA